MSFNNVDLPQPLGPTTTVVVPDDDSWLKSFRASALLKLFDMLFKVSNMAPPVLLVI